MSISQFIIPMLRESKVELKLNELRKTNEIRYFDKKRNEGVFEVILQCAFENMLDDMYDEIVQKFKTTSSNKVELRRLCYIGADEFLVYADDYANMRARMAQTTMHSMMKKQAEVERVLSILVHVLGQGNTVIVGDYTFRKNAFIECYKSGERHIVVTVTCTIDE